jgi:acetyl esterase/lipase
VKFTYKFPLSLSDKCPHCGRPLGLTRKLVRCAYSGEIICTKCIVGSRFSDTVWDKIPREYQQKFRWLDLIPFIAFVVGGFWLMQSAFWTHPGFDLGDLMVALEQVGYIIAFLVIGLILIFSSLRLPPIGSWIFYAWINHGDNRKKVESAVAALADGSYAPSSKPFVLKTRFYSFMKQTGYRIMFIASLACNAAIVPLYWIIRPNMALGGTYFSAVAGDIVVAAIVTTLLTIITGAGFYCSKAAENRKQRILVELMSWLYIIFLPLVYFMYPFGVVASVNYFDGIPMRLATPFFGIHLFSLIAQPAIAILLDLFLLVKAKPDFDRKSYGTNTPRRLTVKGFFSDLVLLIFIGLLLALLMLAFLIIIGDFAYAICILSSTALLFGVAIPVVFVVLKLARRSSHRLNQAYWTLAKIGIIVIAINMIPAMVSDTWTRSNLDLQFSVHFGDDWQARIPANEASRMRQVPFSWFDALYGYGIPGFDAMYPSSGNAKYTIEYCRDSPRYIRYSNGTTTDGSRKNSSIVDTFVFDAYLPQDLHFGDGNPEKLPVVVWFHGIGMDFGTGNENWTSQYIADEGYLVCDLEYGFVNTRGINLAQPIANQEVKNTSRSHRNGYDFPDVIDHIGNFTKYLEANAAYYHADMSAVYFGGRSMGGWVATVSAYGYNATYLKSSFASSMQVDGCISMYGANGIAAGGDNMFFPMYFRNSTLWQLYDPLQLADMSKNGGRKICPSLLIHGTNDDYVPPQWTRELDETLEGSGFISITGYYPLGAHGFDALFWSQYSQSIHYYLERFLALTH